MTPQAVAGTKLVCPECRRENESERIFCHDCGARLDRSKLPKAAAVAKSQDEAHARLKSMFDPNRGKLRQNFFFFSKLILGAVIAATLIQMLRQPDVPEVASGANAPMPQPIGIDLEDAASTGRIPVLRYSEEQVNAFLAYTLKSKRGTLSKYVSFDGLIVTFDEGTCRATVERSFYGLSLCTTAFYAPTLQDGNIALRPRGGTIGRLPVHPALMKYTGFLFDDLRPALERERKSIVKLASFELHPKLVVFLPKQPQT